MSEPLRAARSWCRKVAALLSWGDTVQWIWKAKCESNQCRFPEFVLRWSGSGSRERSMKQTTRLIRKRREELSWSACLKLERNGRICISFEGPVGDTDMLRSPMKGTIKRLMIEYYWWEGHTAGRWICGNCAFRDNLLIEAQDTPVWHCVFCKTRSGGDNKITAYDFLFYGVCRTKTRTY